MKNQIFEQIKEKCPEKKVVGLCNKLIKSCSFRSGADVENLCHLTYWLYLYEQQELALSCVALTKTVEFNKDFRVWDFILDMWGLEARILREQGKNEESHAVAEKMIDCYLAPKNADDTRETMMVSERKWINRHTLSFIDNSNKIDSYLNDNDTKGANERRFTSLFTMISKSECGLFPNLNDNKDEVEAKIKEYISEIVNA